MVPKLTFCHDFNWNLDKSGEKCLTKVSNKKFDHSPMQPNEKYKVNLATFYHWQLLRHNWKISVYRHIYVIFPGFSESSNDYRIGLTTFKKSAFSSRSINHA